MSTKKRNACRYGAGSARTAEATLAELQKDLEARQRLAANAKNRIRRPGEGSTDPDAFPRGRRQPEPEEDRLSRDLAAQKLPMSNLDTDLLAKDQKLRATEHQLQEPDHHRRQGAVHDRGREGTQFLASARR